MSLKRSAEEAKKELDGMVGLHALKQEIRRLEAMLVVNRHRAAAGLPVTQRTYHCVFTGNAGTGKTTVARIFGDLLRENEVLKRGHVVETDRAGLVGNYLGQTAGKTDSKIEEAYDGILFVDEAYTLQQQGIPNGDAYGSEAIDTILKRMEDNRGRLVVVVAGYPEKMAAFIQSNPGLKSRFTQHFNFPDYTPAELFEIFARLSAKDGYQLTSGAIGAVILVVHAMHRRRDESFGNARDVRNLFEEVLAEQAMRLCTEGGDLKSERLHRIEASDVPLDRHSPGDSLRLGTMRWRFTCPSCEAVHNIPTKVLGKSGECTTCKKAVSVTFAAPIPATEA